MTALEEQLDKNELMFHTLDQSFRDALSMWRYPLRFFKWAFPMFMGGVCWKTMSFLLHLETMHYVWHNADGPKVPLGDRGAQWLPQKDIPLLALDIVTILPVGGFMMGCLYLRDVRLWTKIWFTSGLLFLTKGVLDYATDLPDSIGWEKCAERLKDPAVSFFHGLKTVPDNEFWGTFLKMEFFGIADGEGGHIKSVRYCADMMLSGHTFTLVIFLLGFTELVGKFALLLDPWKARLTQGCAAVFLVFCLIVEFVLIVMNRFHYVVDILSSIMVTMILYTNVVIIILAQRFVELGEPELQRHSGAEAMVWVPLACMPCAHGHYEIHRLTHTEVTTNIRKAQRLTVQGAVRLPDERAPLLP